MNVPPVGPIPARLMIVGEAPGAEEERLGEPFVGESGKELTRMLNEAGIQRGECFITNVCRIRPPGNDISCFIARSKKEITSEHTELKGRWAKRPILEGWKLLQAEIAVVKPNVIIALGNTPLWALTGRQGITRWRGSMLVLEGGLKCIPTIHPAAILREWSLRATAILDLKRAATYRDGREYPKPPWSLLVQPTYLQVRLCLSKLLERAGLDGEVLELSFDIETAQGHIDCIGIAWSKNDAICIPFRTRGNSAGYWSVDEEASIVFTLYKLLTHPNVQVTGQNLLYDCQYVHRFWHFIPRVGFDTMLAHHVCFPGLPKKLDFQASMYSPYYIQWKPDRGHWKEGG